MNSEDKTLTPPPQGDNVARCNLAQLKARFGVVEKVEHSGRISIGDEYEFRGAFGTEIWRVALIEGTRAEGVRLERVSE